MREIKGDVTQIQSGVIVHQTNCQNAIGAGVAQAIIDRWPVVKVHYHAFCESMPDPYMRLGYIQPVQVGPDLIVVNSFSQFRYGNGKKNNKTYTYEPLLIRNIQFVLMQYPDKQVYIPGYIGCGLANGDWSQVRDACARMSHNDRLTVVYLDSRKGAPHA